MDDWDFSLVDFWDQTTGAINRNALRLSKLSEPDRMEACSRIRDAVSKRAHALEDNLLLQAAVSMADDLYKYVNYEVMMHDSLFDYFDAFGSTFTKTVRESGYVIRYVVENQFSGVDFLMLGPFDIFPRIFNAAGFVYVCPQQLGLRLMQDDGVAASDYAEKIAQYSTEARRVGDQLVNECHDKVQHYVFLEADYEEGALESALRGRGAPGVLSVFRDDAPVPGSEVSVAFPEPTSGG